MVGKVHLPTMDVCCQRVFVVFKYNTSSNQQRLKKIRKKLQTLFFPVFFFMVFILVLYVLFITNKDPLRFGSGHYFAATDHSENSKFHYGIVIDCGSSGSRVYLYYWPPHNGNPDELLRIQPMIDFRGNPLRKKIRPGISTLAETPHNATSYIMPLLDFASSIIPKSKHGETPLYILATAGMRMLPDQKSTAILENLRTHIPKLYKFHFTSSQAEIISGKQEGIYMWIAINYILGRFDHTYDVHTTPASTVAPISRKQTVGILEMGGASVQIAYEVAPNISIPSELVGEINLGCDSHQTIHKYRIYVTTFLGFGTTSIRSKYLHTLLRKNKINFSKRDRISDPCLPRDMTDEGTIDDESYNLVGAGQFSECQRRLKPLLNTSITCKEPPCSLNGVHQPSIAFDHAEFYGFAEFWYSTDDVLRIGGRYDDDKFDHLAKEFCETRWSVHQRHYILGLYPKADEHRFKYQCFKSAWMTTVLHDGFQFPRGYKGLTSALFVHGKEIQWTLGAILYRTRFMPLREIRHHNQFVSNKASYGLIWIAFDHRTFYGILAVCSVIVIGACILYSRRLRKYTKVTGMTYNATPLPSEVKMAV